MLTAHPRVESSWNRIALKRGPIIFCLEHEDNPRFDVWCAGIRLNSEPIAEFRPDLLGGVMTVKCDGVASEMGIWEDKLYLPIGSVSQTERPVRITAIPYYAWANRDPGPMTVWMNRT